ncbi:unnamed protein product, partial [marine sediment metagenome]
MRQVRQGVFETASSSVHSLSIGRLEKGKHAKLSLDEGGTVCRIYPGEFGWGVNTFRDPHSRASYCLTAAANANNAEGLALLREVIEKETGARV